MVIVLLTLQDINTTLVWRNNQRSGSDEKISAHSDFSPVLELLTPTESHQPRIAVFCLIRASMKEWSVKTVKPTVMAPSILEGGVRGVRKPQNRTEIRQKTANRIGFFPEYRNRAPEGVLGISSDGYDRRIFLGLKFSIPGFFWVREFG